MRKGGGLLTTLLLLQYFLSGIVIGVIYALMAVGITFIYSIMKMINWAMGEFYMIGSYLQYIIVVLLLGPEFWYLGIPLAMLVVFLLGVVVEQGLVAPMFSGAVERRDDYATILTITLAIFLRNLAVIVAGPYIYSVPDYFPPVNFGPLPMSGNRFVAMIAAVIILGLFYLLVKYTWVGLSFRATAQNRFSAQTLGINVLNVDRAAFGLGVALAAAAGAVLAPTFLVYPENGAVATMKGFEIIVIGGLGSIPGSIVAAMLLGLIESMGSAILNPAYRDFYGFALLIAILALRPSGLFGERERAA